jgi:hypothetical protein
VNKLDRMKLSIGDMYVTHVQKMMNFNDCCKYRRDLLSVDVLALNYAELLKARSQVEVLESEKKLLETVRDVRNYNSAKEQEANERERRDAREAGNAKARTQQRPSRKR